MRTTFTFADGTTHSVTLIAEAGGPRRRSYGKTRVRFVNGLTRLFGKGVNSRMSDMDFEQDLRDLLYGTGLDAYVNGLKDGGGDGLLDDSMQSEVDSWLAQQIKYTSGLTDEIYSDGLAKGMIRRRAAMWATKSLDRMYYAGLMRVAANQPYTWWMGPTEQHCNTCSTLNGVTRLLKDWYRRDILPGSGRLECKGFNCLCSLEKAKDQP